MWSQIVGADIEGHILYTYAATEINAHKRTDDFAVLITIQPASYTKGESITDGSLESKIYGTIAANPSQAN